MNIRRKFDRITKLSRLFPPTRTSDPAYVIGILRDGGGKDTSGEKRMGDKTDDEEQTKLCIFP